jgi:hypothetical protein
VSDPIVDPTELGIYLNDPGIDEVRAADLIADAQTLCESIVSPLPAAASVIVKRVAGRAYTTMATPRSTQLGAVGSPFAGQPGGSGGVYLTRYDKADLRNMAGSGGAFSIDLLPSDYAAPVVEWSGMYAGADDWDQIT